MYTSCAIYMSPIIINQGCIWGGGGFWAETPKTLACNKNNHKSWLYKSMKQCVWQHKCTQDEWVQVKLLKLTLLLKGELCAYTSPYGDLNTLIEQSAMPQTTLIKHSLLHLETPF